jgi:hypothetical protein
LAFLPARQIHIRLTFENENLGAASAFAHAFDGKVLNTPEAARRRS